MSTLFKEFLSKVREDFQLFIETGMVETRNMRDSCALKLFCAAKIVCSDSNIPDICLGYMAMQRMEMRSACETLSAVIEKDPDNCLALSMLGVCLSFFPSSIEEGDKLLERAVNSSEDNEIVAVCEIAKKWIKEDKRFKKDKQLLA